jgi:hypothetical protein
VLPPLASAENCPNSAYRVGPSALLPDCRAYEQVTPFEPTGDTFYVNGLGLAPEGVPTVSLESFSPFADAENDEGVGGIEYSIARTPSGWTTTPMALPASKYSGGWPVGDTGPGMRDSSLDGSTYLWLAQAHVWAEDRIDFVLSRRDGSKVDAGPVDPPGSPPIGRTSGALLQEVGDLGLIPRGFSDDMSHIYFAMAPKPPYHYWPSDETKPSPNPNGTPAQSLYEYVGAENSQPMLVGLDDKGRLISTCGTGLGSATGLREKRMQVANLHNAVSNDGNTAYFLADAEDSEEYPGCYGPPVNELFVRIDNGMADAHTVAISEPSADDCPLCNTSREVLRPAEFEGASQDGSKAFFTTSQPLLGDDTSQNIYEYDFDAPAGQSKVVRVSGGDDTVQGPTAEVEGIVRTSEDGSHVYFVAKGVLTRTSNERGQVALTGANNLYVYERDAQYPNGRTEFIANLPAGDASLWGPAADVDAEADTTPEGRFLVFVSNGDLTPDDTSSQPQVFEYDSQAGTLARVSVGENGYNGNGNNHTIEGGTARIPRPDFNYIDRPQAYWSSLSVSADGSYVFFASSLALTPQATNNQEVEESPGERRPIVNIYEYHDGQVYLISDPGSTRASSTLVGTDVSGADVILESEDELVPQDTQPKKNVFDARIDGGFPVPATSGGCSGDGCQGPLSGAPVLLSPGSEFQAGGGNFAPNASPSDGQSKAKAKPKKKGNKKKAAGHKQKVRPKERKAKRASTAHGRRGQRRSR